MILACCMFAAAAAEVVVEESLDICPVWAGHPVGFCLLTEGERQFVAFYDAERRLTVAARTLGESEWQLSGCPRVWDGTATTRLS